MSGRDEKVTTEDRPEERKRKKRRLFRGLCIALALFVLVAVAAW